MLTLARLKQLLRYEPETGHFYWLAQRGKNKLDVPAGSPSSKGHLQIRIDGKKYLNHRLAWLWVHGEWPSALIDHENRNPADNRISNLRKAGYALNRLNSNAQGVTRNQCGNWRAHICRDGREIHLGTFKCWAQAKKARHAALDAAIKELAA